MSSSVSNSHVSQRSLMDMPGELLDAIVAEVQCKSDLLSLAQTCRYLDEMAERRLYKVIQVPWPAMHMKPIRAAIKANPTRAQMVRSFFVSSVLYFGMNLYMRRYNTFTCHDVLLHLSKLERLYIEAEWSSPTRRQWDKFAFDHVARRGILRSLMTCTIHFRSPHREIEGHHFNPIIMLPNLRNLDMHNIDSKITKYDNPSIALQSLLICKSLLTLDGVKATLRATTSLRELYLSQNRSEDTFEYSDLVEALGSVGATLRKLVIKRPVQKRARRPMCLHNMVALQYLSVDIDIWLAGLCDTPYASSETWLKPLFPPKLETLQTTGLWTGKPQRFVDDHLVDLLGPIFTNKKELAPLLSQILLPGQGECYSRRNYRVHKTAGISSAFVKACGEAGILITQDKLDSMNFNFKDRQSDRLNNTVV